MPHSRPEYAEEIQDFAAVNALLGRAVTRATLRRLVAGPRRPGRSWLYECMAEVMEERLRIASVDTIPRYRRSFERLSQRTPLPPDVQVEPATLAGVSGEWVRTSGCREDVLLLYLHGGGYITGSTATHRRLIISLSQQTGLPALGIDYRLAPEAPYPAALLDAWRAYWSLLESGYDPARIIIGGDSAGGGLAVSLMLAARDAGLPLPAAAVCLSPWTDLALTGQTLVANEPFDYLDLPTLVEAVPLILDSAEPKLAGVSPLYADLSELPPLLIQAGTTEMLYEDAARLAKRASLAGVEVEFEPWENMVHVWHFMSLFEPAARDAIASIARFVHKHMPAQSDFNSS